MDLDNVSEILRILFKQGNLNANELLKLNCIFNYIGKTVTRWIAICHEHIDEIKEMKNESASKKLLQLLSKSILTKDQCDAVLSHLADEESFLLLEWEDRELHESITDCLASFHWCLLIIESIKTLRVKYVWLVHNDGGAGMGVNQERVRLTRVFSCLIFGIKLMESITNSGGHSDINLAECIIAYIKSLTSMCTQISETKTISYADMAPNDIETTDWSNWDQSKIEYAIKQALMEVREDSGVRIGTLRQELNRKMNLLSFLKSVQTKKLETVYTFLSKSKRMKMLFEHRNLFITTNLDDKQLKGRQLMEQPEFIGILDRVKRELQLLNVTHTDPPNLFIVIQMFMIHKKIIKLKKKSKTQETIVNVKFKLEHCESDESDSDGSVNDDESSSEHEGSDDDPYDSAYDTKPDSEGSDYGSD